MNDAQTIFRDVINRQHIHAKLRRNDADFTAICAAMDKIRDADTAFGEFLSRVRPNKDAQQLEILGVYQAVQLTVVSLRALENRLKVVPLRKPEIGALATERSRIAGHPVGWNEDGVQYSSFIHPFKMSPTAVEVRHIGSKKGSSWTETYSPVETIARTKDLRDRALIEMAKGIVAIDREERLAKVSDSLASCFHSSTDWMLQHVAVAPYSESEREGILDASVNTLCKQLGAFVERTKRLDLGDVYPETIRDAKTTIAILERVLVLARQAGAEPSIDIIAFSESAVARIKDLVRLAQEIDESLAEDVRAIA
ncbi:MAG: hypothetical protein NBV67_12570 [Tagaea sp.]|nr:hypothetical protein [Tagaea sp.]